MDRRGAISTTGGVLLATGATNAVTWGVGASAPDSNLSTTPTYLFAGLAVLGAVIAVGALTSIWPFNHLVSAADMLDDCIRRGDEARTRIIYGELDGFEAAAVAAVWQKRTMNRITRYHPSALADFVLAKPGDEATAGSQAQAVRVLAVKIAALSAERKALGG
jgi:hypothetical protein